MMSSKSKNKFNLTPEQSKAVLNQLLAKEDNKTCADCYSRGPRWASWNLGVVLCIRCSGIHRGLGVHITRVKSVTLDAWTEEQLISICSRGNGWAKEVYEAKLPKDFKRPMTDLAAEQFIRDKYEKRKYKSTEEVPLRSLEEFKVFSTNQANDLFPKKDVNGNFVASQRLESAIPRPKPRVHHSSPPVAQSNLFENEVGETVKKSNMEDLLGLDDFPSSASPDSTSTPALAGNFNNSTNFDLFEGFQQNKSSTSASDAFSSPTQSSTAQPMSKDNILSLYSLSNPASMQQNPYMMPGPYPSQPPSTMMGFQGYPQHQVTNMGLPFGKGFPQQAHRQLQPANTPAMQQYQWQQQQVSLQQQQQQQQMQNLRMGNNLPMGVAPSVNQTPIQQVGFGMPNTFGGNPGVAGVNQQQAFGSWNNPSQVNGGQTFSSNLWK